MSNKKLLVVSVCLLTVLLLLSSLAFARKLSELTELDPGIEAPKPMKQTGPKVIVSTEADVLKGPSVKSVKDMDYAILASTPNDSVFYYNIPGEPSANFTGSAGEILAVIFHPATECSLYALKFTNDGCDGGGTVKLGVYESPITLAQLKAQYDPVTSGNGTPLPSDLGDQLLAKPIWGPFDLNLNASASSYVTNLVDLAAKGDGYKDIGSKDFIVAYEWYVNGCPTSRATSIAPSNYDYWAASIKYYNTVSPNGWRYRNYNWWFKALVYYYGDPPPKIENVTKIVDNYKAGQTYPVQATITDKGLGGGPGQVDSAFVLYSVTRGSTTTTTKLYATAVGDVYSVTLPAGQVGDVYQYYFVAYDNATPEPKFTESAPMRFTIRAPKYPILFVNDGANTLLDPLYTNILKYYGFNYDYWNIASYGMPGNDVINNTNYSSIIWYTSLGSGVMSNLEDLVKAYLDGGGNLFFSSSEFLGDYYGFADCDANPGGDFTATAGEFPYDYFKIDFGKSDANVDCAGTSTGDGLDTLYFGVAGDPLTGAYTAGFDANPYNLGYTQRWNDEVVAQGVAGVRDAFEVYSIADGANVPAGIVYEGTYKLVFLPWIFEAAPDEFMYPFLKDVLIWFGEKSVPVIANVKGPENYMGTRNMGPYNISADVTDTDGDALTVNLLYKGTRDAGMTNVVAMTKGTGDTYTATIPAMDTTGYVNWQIQAISGTPADTVLSVVPVRIPTDAGYYRFYVAPPKTEGVNVLLVNDYGRGGATNSFLPAYKAALDSLHVAYDFYDVYLNSGTTSRGAPDNTILNEYDVVIVNADGGPGLYSLSYYTQFGTNNPLAKYLDQGGKLFISGDEFFAFPAYRYYRLVLGQSTYNPWVGNLGGFNATTKYPFAYNYLGLTNAYEDDEFNDGVSGTTADSVVGVMGDPITGAFSGGWLTFDPSLIDPNNVGNWSNALFVGTDTTVYYGVRNSNGTFKTVFNSFILEMLDADTREAYMQNVLNWFDKGTETGPSGIFTTPHDPPTTVTFQVSMKYWTVKDTMFLAGGPAPLSWDSPWTILSHVPGPDSLWTTTVTFSGSLHGETVWYKFKNGRDSWEEFIGKGARSFDLTGGTIVLPVAYFNDWPGPEVIAPLTQSLTVRFNLYAGTRIPGLGIDDVGISGDVLPEGFWTTPTTSKLSDPDGDDIWTGEVVFPAGTPGWCNYKFRLHDADYGSWLWEGVPYNRQLRLSGYTGNTIETPIYIYQEQFDTLAPGTVRFNVSMQYWTPQADTIFLAGGLEPLANWSDKFIPMTDSDENGVWGVNLDFPDSLTGRTVYYKFKDGRGHWEEFLDKGARSVEIKGGTQGISLVYYTDWAGPTKVGPLANDVTVNFSLYAGTAVGVNVDDAGISGDMLPEGFWVTPVTSKLSDPNSDNVWTGSVVFRKGTQGWLNYKFRLHEIDFGSWLWEGIEHNRRLRISGFDTVGAVINLPIYVWGDEDSIYIPVSVDLDRMKMKLAPTVFNLSQNYPNPFNPVTQIAYQIPEKANVTIGVYNIMGQLVRTLVNTEQDVGYYRITWNGKDDNGRDLSSGIYIYRMNAGKFTSTKKMIMMK